MLVFNLCGVDRDYMRRQADATARKFYGPDDYAFIASRPESVIDGCEFTTTYIYKRKSEVTL